jgi:hypothetical protein
MDHSHALISAFLQQASISSMVSDDHRPIADRFTKAGVVPFVRGTPRQYYFMKPNSTIEGLGEAPYQICKGTRMYYRAQQGWHDIRDPRERGERQEALLVTALREGIEELGLKLESITRIIEMGPYGFASATTGRSKEMWLFALEMQADGFGNASEVAASTASRAWMHSAQFTATGRDDHRPILRDIDDKLSLYYKE